MVQRRRVGRLVLALSTSLLAVVTFVPSANPAQSATGLVAGYAFNEGSGTTAANASGSGLTGTFTNGATWGAGRNAGAVQLDGANDYVELGNPAALQLTGSMTVSAWVNSAAFPGDDAAIVSKRELRGRLPAGHDDRSRAAHDRLQADEQLGRQRVPVRGDHDAGQHLVSRHRGVQRGDVRAARVSERPARRRRRCVGTVTSTQQNSTANVNIGRRPTGNGFNFNGRIDDVRIYGRALTPGRDPSGHEHPGCRAPALVTRQAPTVVDHLAGEQRAGDRHRERHRKRERQHRCRRRAVPRRRCQRRGRRCRSSVRVGVGYAHGRRTARTR